MDGSSQHVTACEHLLGYTYTSPLRSNIRSHHNIQHHLTNTNMDSTSSQAIGLLPDAAKSTSVTAFSTTKDQEARRRLAEEILALIEPHTKTDVKPPFTTPELIVMAYTTLGSCNSSAVLHWILSTFQFYNAKAIKEYVAKHGSGNLELIAVVPDLCESLNHWCLPVVPLSDSTFNTVTSSISMHRGLFGSFGVTPEAARVFLRRWLEKNRSGTFPFFKLPAELRNTIYAMVLSFPASGIDFEEPGRLYARNRPDDPSITALTQARRSYQNRHLQIETGEYRVLDLLRVNKQLFAEAMPIFYGVNTFRCVNCVRATIEFFRNMPTERIKHLTKLELGFDIMFCQEKPRARILKGFKSAMSKLARHIGKLETLVIVIDDRRWLSVDAVGRRYLKASHGHVPTFVKFDDVPGFLDLTRACAAAEHLVAKGCTDGFKRWIERKIEEHKKVEAGKCEQST